LSRLCTLALGCLLDSFARSLGRTLRSCFYLSARTPVRSALDEERDHHFRLSRLTRAVHLLGARTRSSSGQNIRDRLSPLTHVRPSSNSRIFFGSVDTFRSCSSFDEPDLRCGSSNPFRGSHRRTFACIVPRVRSLPTSAFLSRGSPFGAFRSRLLRPTKLSIRAPLSELASRCLVRAHRFALAATKNVLPFRGSRLQHVRRASSGCSRGPPRQRSSFKDYRFGGREHRSMHSDALLSARSPFEARA
jgi:hypothetical protein